MILKLMLFTTAFALAGCANLSIQQQTSLRLELSLAQQLGSDAVQVWCAASGIVYVVANAESGNKSNPSKAVLILQNNANAAAQACPMIASVTAIKTALAAPSDAKLSPVTP